MAEHKTKRFRLAFVNAAEDVPRIVRGYGRACFGEFALVLRPAEKRGAMVRITKDGAWMWRATDALDAPVLPEVPTTSKDAVALVKTEQKAVPKPGPITLRGQWSGHLVCEEGVPHVELVRKIASYAVLRITSSATRWYWKVERAEKWFSGAGSSSGTAVHLIEAIEQGLVHAIGLVGEACSARDTRRRAALDEGYAEAHPIAPAKERPDPTERLRAKGEVVSVELPAVPSTREELAVMADEVAAEATALAADAESDDIRSAYRISCRARPIPVAAEACRGRERTSATAALRRAQVALDGADGDAPRAVRRVSEEVALAAAKAARSCAAGQLALPASPPSTKPRRRKSTAAADPAKDQALLQAFTSAIAEAMGQVQVEEAGSQVPVPPPRTGSRKRRAAAKASESVGHGS